MSSLGPPNWRQRYGSDDGELEPLLSAAVVSGGGGSTSRRGALSWRYVALLALAVSLVVMVLVRQEGGSPLMMLQSEDGATATGPAAAARQRVEASPLYQKAKSSKARRFSDMSDAEQRAAFEDFLGRFSKEYSQQEREERYRVFQTNLALIDALNDANPMAYFGINKHADSTPEERAMRLMDTKFFSRDALRHSVPPPPSTSRQQKLLEQRQQGQEQQQQGRQQEPPKQGQVQQVVGAGASPRMALTTSTKPVVFKSQVGWMTEDDCSACSMYPDLGAYSLDSMPTAWDWRDYMAMTVQDQGSCGSCYIFSATADLEGTWYLATGESLELSKQQPIACDDNTQMATGCGGGWPFGIWEYASQIGGIVYADAYPYVDPFAAGATAPLPTPTCDKDIITAGLQSKEVAHAGGWQFVSALDWEDEELMALGTVKNGPISICISSGGGALIFYEYGIFGCPAELADTILCTGSATSMVATCDASSIDHAVVIVGYGEEDSVPYWIIRNSWGADWGEAGYYRMVRGQDYCGVGYLASTTVIKQA